MDVVRIKEQYLKTLKIIPTGKNMIVSAQEVDNSSSIVLPGDQGAGDYATRMAGRGVLIVDIVGEECTKIKAGDYIVPKPRSETMFSFKVADDGYMVVNEDDIVVVMRGEEGDGDT